MRRQRDRVNARQARREHVRGQEASRLGPNRLDLTPGHQPGRELGGLGPSRGHHPDDGGVDAVDGTEHRLHLREFDAVAADLDLVVVAPDEIERAVRTTANDIAGAVHPAPGPPRIRDEPDGRLPGAAAIAVRFGKPREIQLPLDAWRHDREIRVQDACCHVADRATDMRFGARHPTQHRVDGEFTGSVQVPPRQLRGVGDLSPQRRRYGFTAQGHGQSAATLAERIDQPDGDQLAKIRRGGLDDVDGAIGQEVGNAFGIDALFFGGNLKRGPADEPQQRVPGGVEAEPAEMEHARQPLDACTLMGFHQMFAVVDEHVLERTMWHLDGFGGARGPRGVHEVGGVFRCRAGRNRVPGRSLKVRRIQEPHGSRRGRQRILHNLGDAPGFHDRGPGLRAGDDPGDTGRRIGDVDRHGHRSGPQARQDADERVDGAWKSDDHAVSGLHARCGQVRGAVVHGGRHLGEVQCPVLIGQRW